MVESSKHAHLIEYIVYTNIFCLLLMFCDMELKELISQMFTTKMYWLVLLYLSTQITLLQEIYNNFIYEC